MEYRRLGRSGLKISQFSFGSWVTFGPQIDEKGAQECLKAAFDAGINFFDNAEVYAKGRSELIMGRALKKLGLDRDAYCVSSKVYFGSKQDPAPTQRGLSRKHVLEACDQALERLQLDYLDLYFCHRPDPETPIEETVRAMDDLIRQGKVLYWGTSEWSAQEIMQAWSVARQYNLVPPTMEQPEYNMFNRVKVEQEFARLYDEIGLGTTIWSPLASGLLTGKYNDGIPGNSRANVPGYEWLRERFQGPVGQARIATVRRLNKVADEAGISMTHLALGWCARNPNVSTVILGASRVEQLHDNLAALRAMPGITPDVMTAVDDILAEHRE
ncbi:MAG: aldo/keto reductase [Gammaproteobacteria bacterium]|jgi:voltage-dependent potassium channel beta subunit